MEEVTEDSFLKMELFLVTNFEDRVLWSLPSSSCESLTMLHLLNIASVHVSSGDGAKEEE